MERFRDRLDAASQLAGLLAPYRQADAVVLGLPRGGVPIAAGVAEALGLPLDVLVVRKLGVPGHEEVAMGAVGEERAVVINDDIVASSGIGAETIERAIAIEQAEVACLHAPTTFMAVGMHYLDFEQVDDDEVSTLLRAARKDPQGT